MPDWRAILAAEVDTLTARLGEMGGAYQASLDEVRAYAAAKADELSRAAGQPGFATAAHAAALDIAGLAAITTVHAADALDAAAREAWVAGLASALRVTASVIASL